MTRRKSVYLYCMAVVLTAGLFQACRQARGEGTARLYLGPETTLGTGGFASFARFDRAGVPLAIGVSFSADALTALPTDRSDRHRCFDLDGSGAMDVDTECLPTHERVLPLPAEASRRADIPFKWVLLNWNPEGHAPTEVFGPAHFDIHFFIESIENTFALIPGPCGPELIRCDQFELAVRPVPANYIHPDFQNVDAAAPAMGNHLIDLTSHEFHGQPFDRTWIYGSYDGRVTFWEEMVTRDFLAARPDTCFDIKTPADVAVAGYYPTRICYRFDASRNEQAVVLEGFESREAAPPATAD